MALYIKRPLTPDATDDHRPSRRSRPFPLATEQVVSGRMATSNGTSMVEMPSGHQQRAQVAQTVAGNQSMPRTNESSDDQFHKRSQAAVVAHTQERKLASSNAIPVGARPDQNGPRAQAPQAALSYSNSVGVVGDGVVTSASKADVKGSPSVIPPNTQSAQPAIPNAASVRGSLDFSHRGAQASQLNIPNEMSAIGGPVIYRAHVVQTAISNEESVVERSGEIPLGAHAAQTDIVPLWDSISPEQRIRLTISADFIRHFLTFRSSRTLWDGTFEPIPGKTVRVPAILRRGIHVPTEMRRRELCALGNRCADWSSFTHILQRHWALLPPDVRNPLERQWADPELGKRDIRRLEIFYLQNLRLIALLTLVELRLRNRYDEDTDLYVIAGIKQVNLYEWLAMRLARFDLQHMLPIFEAVAGHKWETLAVVDDFVRYVAVRRRERADHWQPLVCDEPEVRERKRRRQMRNYRSLYQKVSPSPPNRDEFLTSWITQDEEGRLVRQPSSPLDSVKKQTVDYLMRRTEQFAELLVRDMARIGIWDLEAYDTME